MSDLDHRFRSLDGLEPTELREDIERRAGVPEGGPSFRPSGGRLVAAIVALTVFAVAAGFGWIVWHRSTTPVVEEPAGPFDDLTPGFTQLTPVPFERQGAGIAWGSPYLLLWGGQDSDGKPHHSDGVIYDAELDAWRPMAPAPISPRSWPGVVWTGTEFVIWGGSEGNSPSAANLSDGAAYDPSTDTWRRLGAGGIAPSAPLVSIWTDREAIFMGGYDGEPGGAAYDPVLDSWRTIPDAPVEFTDATSVWTGRELVVFGAFLGPGNHPRTPATGAAYDPVSDAWRLLPDSDLSPNSNRLVWDGTRLVAIDYELRAQTLDEAAGDWVDIPTLPANSCEGGLSAGGFDGVILANDCGELMELRPGSEHWHVVVGRGERDDVEYGSVLAASGAFLVRGYPRGEELPPLFVYRPTDPADVPALRRAWDVAAAFGALRSHYPYSQGSVPEPAASQMRTLISTEARQGWEDPESGLERFWDYYPGFEVRGVEDNADGTFDATISFAGYSGGDFREVVTIGPGSDMDGGARDLLVVDARPG